MMMSGALMGILSSCIGAEGAAIVADSTAAGLERHNYTGEFNRRQGHGCGGDHMNSYEARWGTRDLGMLDYFPTQGRNGEKAGTDTVNLRKWPPEVRGDGSATARRPVPTRSCQAKTAVSRRTARRAENHNGVHAWAKKVSQTIQPSLTIICLLFINIFTWLIGTRRGGGMGRASKDHLAVTTVRNNKTKNTSRRTGGARDGRRCSGKKGRPWEGTKRWAFEGVQVGRQRCSKVRPAGTVRALRLGNKEWWAVEWAPWKHGCGIGQSGIEDEWAQRWQGRDGANHAASGLGPCGTPQRCPRSGYTSKDGIEGGSSTSQPRPKGARRHPGNHGKIDRARRTTRYGQSKRIVTAIMTAMLVGCRIGEAGNPGHGLLDPAIMKLKAIDLPNKKDQRVKYADPQQQGFRGGKGPGFNKDFAPRMTRDRPQEEVQMKIESANVTGPAGLRTRLRATNADIFLAQETWVTEGMIQEVREWARRRKWTSIWAPAKPGTDGGRPSGGVAIFVRSHFGLKDPEEGGPVWVQHRVCAGVVELPGYRPTIVASAYFSCGEHWGIENVTIMANICASLEAQGKLPAAFDQRSLGATST